MLEKLMDEVYTAGTNEINALLKEHMPKINKAMMSMAAETDSEKTLKYPVKLTLVIEPHNAQAKVTAKISYSVSHSDETEGIMVDPNQMTLGFVKSEGE